MDDEKLLEQLNTLVYGMRAAFNDEDIENLPESLQTQVQNRKALQAVESFILTKGKDCHPYIKEQFDYYSKNIENTAESTMEKETALLYMANSTAPYMLFCNYIVKQDVLSEKLDSHHAYYDDSLTNEDKMNFLNKEIKYALDKYSDSGARVNQKELDHLNEQITALGLELLADNNENKGGKSSIMVASSEGHLLASYDINFDNAQVSLKKPKTQR